MCFRRDLGLARVQLPTALGSSATRVLQTLAPTTAASQCGSKCASKWSPLAMMLLPAGPGSSATGVLALAPSTPPSLWFKMYFKKTAYGAAPHRALLIGMAPSTAPVYGLRCASKRAPWRGHGAAPHQAWLIDNVGFTDIGTQHRCEPLWFKCASKGTLWLRASVV